MFIYLLLDIKPHTFGAVSVVSELTLRSSCVKIEVAVLGRLPVPDSPDGLSVWT